MHEEPAVRQHQPRSTPKPEKESFFQRNGHIIFWGSLVAMPTLNVIAAVINARTAEKGLESDQLKLALEELKQRAQQ